MATRTTTMRQPLRRQTVARASSGAPDFLFLLLTIGILCFGLAMVFSSSSMTSSYQYQNYWHYFLRQFGFAMVGFIGMIVIMKTPIEMIKRFTRLFFLICIILLILVVFVGSKVNGAKSWFGIGPFGIQPTEFVKLALVLFMSAYIVKIGDKYKSFKDGLLKSILHVGMICGLVAFQPDVGGVLILGMTGLVVMILGGANLRQLVIFLLILSFVLMFVLMIIMVASPDFIHSYRVQRFTAFWDPWKDPQHSGYHIIQSLFAFAHGNFFGTGFGQSIQKLHYLPEAHNDFIFAIIGEEFGFLGTALFLLVYLAFIARGFVLSMRCRDPFGSLAGMGFMACVAIQAIINLFGVSDLMPLTGVTLPLISYGGSSMLVTLVGVGIILSASRQDRLN